MSNDIETARQKRAAKSRPRPVKKPRYPARTRVALHVRGAIESALDAGEWGAAADLYAFAEDYGIRY